MKKGTSSAFPIFLQEGLSHNSHVDCGMSTRLYLAGMAMQGMLANSHIYIVEMSVQEKSVIALNQADELLKQEQETL